MEVGYEHDSKKKTQDKTTENEKREIFKWISICEWRNEPHLKYFLFLI